MTGRPGPSPWPRRHGEGSDPGIIRKRDRPRRGSRELLRYFAYAGGDGRYMQIVGRGAPRTQGAIRPRGRPRYRRATIMGFEVKAPMD